MYLLASILQKVACLPLRVDLVYHEEFDNVELNRKDVVCDFSLYPKSR